MTEPRTRPDRQSAVALAYGAGDGAPRVVAKGNGLVAEQIMDRARAAGVFVHQSKELVALLMNVDLDSQVPPALYRAIAELLAWLYHIELQQGGAATIPAAPNLAIHLDSSATARTDASND